MSYKMATLDVCFGWKADRGHSDPTEFKTITTFAVQSCLVILIVGKEPGIGCVKEVRTT